MEGSFVAVRFCLVSSTGKTIRGNDGQGFDYTYLIFTVMHLWREKGLLPSA